MDKNMLVGMGRQVLPIPPAIWKHMHEDGGDPMDFMSPDHQRVRDFAVTELPLCGIPLTPERIAQELDLPLARVVELLQDLERHKTFIYRNPQGAVTWAYPVTVDETPHRVRFSYEDPPRVIQVYAAWAFDAIAVPFVQGQLRNEYLACEIETECGHCRQPIRIKIDSELNYEIMAGPAEPLVYSPLIDVAALEPGIIDGYWRKSLFFWSEEHAKEYRRKTGGERGAYLTLAQCIHFVRRSQSALFGFPRS